MKISAIFYARCLQFFLEAIYFNVFIYRFHSFFLFYRIWKLACLHLGILETITLCNAVY